jgi:hypothetical protein
MNIAGDTNVQIIATGEQSFHKDWVSWKREAYLLCITWITWFLQATLARRFKNKQEQSGRAGFMGCALRRPALV